MWRGRITAEFTQWGVAEGGFHTQLLEFQERTSPGHPNPWAPLSKTQFRVIYDCGSRHTQTQFINPSIDAFVNTLDPDESIDLLVISHFDSDHVNGLDHLATRLKTRHHKVKEIWTPLLTKLQALSIIATTAPSNRGSASLIDLVANPVGRLEELFPGATVTPIPPSTEATPLASNPNDDSTTEPGTVPRTVHNQKAHVLRIQYGASSGVEMLWEIVPYVTNATTIVSQNLITMAENALGGTKHKDWTPDDLKRLPKLDPNTGNPPKKLGGAKKPPTFGKIMRDAINKQDKRGKSDMSGTNRSSVCLYSGPVDPYSWGRYPRTNWWTPNSTSSVPLAPSWLGTGDADLKQQIRVDDLKARLLPQRLDRVGMSSVPHHGSRHNSEAELWDAMPNLRHVTLEADRVGRNKHRPHASVLLELGKRNLTMERCVNGTNYTLRITLVR
jgi:hypothetical protein